MSKTLEEQERMIQEMSTFMHDSLDTIFMTVEQKQLHIEKTVKIEGSRYYRHENDPFRLYQSYLEVVKPIDYELDLKTI